MPVNLENSAVATGLEKVSFHSNLKERLCQRTLKLPHNCIHLTHSKVMLKTLQARFQQHMNRELPDVQAGFRKGRGTADQIAKSVRSLKKWESFRKTSTSGLTDYTKAFDCVDHNKLWKILQEMGIPDHFTCLLRNLYASQEATVRSGHGIIDWFQQGREYVKAVYCHPAYLIHMQSISWEMLGWMKHKLWSRLPGEISITSICRCNHLYGRKWRRTKEPLDERERGEWKTWLKTQHSKN